MSLFLFSLMLLIKLIFIGLNPFDVQAVGWAQSLSNWHHLSKKLSTSSIKNIIDSINGHSNDFNATLDSILIPRVPGTENHDKVRKYIIDTMKSLKWDIEEDKFINSTPHGRKPFSNVIATLNSEACRRLVIACHYDSLVNREGTFVGATDSAVPCTMMIHLARLLDNELKKQRKKTDMLTLQFIFFDGEEAFRKWSKTDSLYGSRHLAEKWNEMRSNENYDHCKTYGDFVNILDHMDVLVLLDLLGAPNPSIYSYFPDTHSLYMELVNTETKLNSLKHLENHPPQQTTQYFNRHTTLAFIEDDHIPFMKRGVPIIHVIPSPFPVVWHRESDNRENLHQPTINNLNKILFVFVAEYLHLYSDRE